jgi:hydroxyacylglutathione hydrolase
MRVLPIACLSDNYAYLLQCRETKEAAIVDASEAGPVLRARGDGGAGADSRRDLAEVAAGAANREEANVVAVLSTHHHFDHVGGNEEVKAKLGIARVYGSVRDRGRIPGQTHFLEDGETFTVGRLTVRALHVPGHTLGALAYVVTGAPGDDPAVFTGDTLFVAGCGRLFEGDPEMMHASLEKLAALDPRTRVFCGHEYTESNLRFAAHLEPSNQAVDEARARAADARREGRPTVPGAIAVELATNPFLRVGSPEIRATLGIPEGASPAAAFAAIRKAKDTFR